MRHALALLFALLLSIPSVSVAGPDEALAAFLDKTVPADSEVRKHGALGQMQLTRLDRIERAVPLRFFEPYKLVPFVYMDPMAGPPGIVLVDIRIAWTPGTEDFVVIDWEWLTAHRKAHPIDVSALSNEDLSAYLSELVSLVPGADRWGFVVVKLTRSQRGTTVVYKTPRRMDLGDQERSQTVVFTDTGAVASWKLLEREFRQE